MATQDFLNTSFYLPLPYSEGRVFVFTGGFETVPKPPWDFQGEFSK